MAEPPRIVSISGESASRSVPKVVVDIEAEIPLRVVAHELPGTVRDPRLFMVREPNAPSAAGFRLLRHRLVHGAAPRVIVTSSAQRGEGRTTCAINLAGALAEEGARVALVEADLRAPAMARLFRYRPPWCIASQLGRSRDLTACWTLVRVDPTRLFVAAVDPRSRRRRVDEGPGLRRAITRLRQEFDHVVVDAPPILGSAEVNALQSVSDGVLVVTRARRSRGRQVRRALEQLEPGPVLGVLLLGAEG